MRSMDIARDCPTRHDAVARLARRLAALGAEAVRQSRPPSLAVSSRVESAVLADAFSRAFEEVRGLAESIHLFPSDTPLAAPREEDAPLAPLREKLGLRAGQVQLPEDTLDVVAAARAFESDLRRHFRLAGGALPAFDAIVLAPADLSSPRHADAAERLATGVYNVSTGHCSVALTVASLAGARALVTFGPAEGAPRTARFPASFASRAEPIHWVAAPRAAQAA